MMVEFFTITAVGHETRRISARVSRMNWPRRSKNPRLTGAFDGRRPPSPEEPDGVPHEPLAGGAPDESKSSAAAVSVSSSAESSLTVVFPNLFDTYVSQIKLAGVPGLEPAPSG